jgi:DNA-binding transcriptional ArsR family regulator
MPAQELMTRAAAASLLLDLASDGTRAGVLMLLAEAERNVGPLCEAAGMSQPAMSHHLAILRHAGAVTFRREGKTNVYHLTPKGRRLVAALAAVSSS